MLLAHSAAICKCFACKACNLTVGGEWKRNMAELSTITRLGDHATVQQPRTVSFPAIHSSLGLPPPPATPRSSPLARQPLQTRTTNHATFSCCSPMWADSITQVVCELQQGLAAALSPTAGSVQSSTPCPC